MDSFFSGVQLHFTIDHISEDVFLQIKNYTISKDDLYVTIAGTIGVAGEVPTELDGMNLTENAVKVTYIQINKTFLCLILQSEFVQQQFQDRTHQVAMPKLALERILSTLIPVCSMAAQSAIVNKFVEMDLLISQIGEAKEGLAETVSKAKAKILDLAIRGLLVPQDPADEPASVLLERIRAEKEELIKQGKIKRDKKESVIFRGEDNSYYEKIGDDVRCIDSELPFELPDTWMFVRLKHIGEIVGGGTPKTNISEYWDGNIPWLTPADFSGYEEMYVFSGARTITEIGLKSSSAQMLPANSVLYSSRAPIGYIAIAATPVSTNQGFKSVVPYDFAMSPYLYYCLKARTDDIIQRATGTTFKEISGSEMAETIIPLPPIAEQKRIFEKATQLLNIITTIEKSLN